MAICEPSFKESSRYAANPPRPSLALRFRKYPCHHHHHHPPSPPIFCTAQDHKTPLSLSVNHHSLPRITTTTMFRRRINILEPPPASLFTPSIETLDFSFFPEPPPLSFPLHFSNHNFSLFDLRALPFNGLDTVTDVTDLITIGRNPLSPCYRRMKHRPAWGLEVGFDRVVEASLEEGDRKYRWTSEIRSPRKGGVDRRYKWKAEIKGKHSDDIWTVEIKGPKSAAGESSSGAGKGGKKKSAIGTRTAESDDSDDDQAATSNRKTFCKKGGGTDKGKGKKEGNGKGKRKELSPQDAALLIQVSFKNYLLRRSQALRAIRELAAAKAKLKELRSLFHNFLYRHCMAHDAEQRQMFSDKIIVLLLTIDAIEGVDLMVRAARRSMVDELEAMLDVTDPQLPRKMGSVRRRKFDLDEDIIQNEIAAGVAEVVHMLDQEDKYGGETFEPCL